MPARRLALLATVLATTPLFAAGARADTVQVTAGTDSGGAGCELRDAIGTFNSGTPAGNCALVGAPGTDQITFAGGLTGATINLGGGELGVNPPDPLQIVGPGMGSLTISADIGSRVFNVGSGTVTISGTTIRDGAPNGAGGAVRGGCVLNNGTLILNEVRVTNCEANVTDSAADVFGDGGGIGNEGTLTLNSSLVDDNEATGINTQGAAGSGQARGAGIYSDVGASLTINDSSISGNEASASDNGTGSSNAFAGIADAGGTLTISQSTLSDNSAAATEASGQAATAGGLYTNASTATIEQSTIAGNIADPNGTIIVQAGGIYSQGTTTIRSSTIALNGPTSASENGANLNSDNGAVTIANTILADPRGGAHNCADIGNIIATSGFNDDYSPGGSSCFPVPLPTDQTANPLLATAGLASNGGPTETIALQATSPLIDKGSNAGNTELATDQRGLPRPVDFPGLTDATGGNGTDIGAFEVQQACAGQSTPTTACPSPSAPVTPVTPVKTGKRAKALKKCKKIKNKKKRKKCRKKAKKKPV